MVDKSVFDLLFDDKKPEKKHKNIGSSLDSFLEEEGIKEEIEENLNVVLKVFDTVYKAKESIIFEQGEIKCDGVKVADTPVCPTPIELIKGKQVNRNFYKE
jgi:hypothetical protein